MKRIQKKVDKVMRRFSRILLSAPPAVDAPRDREVITGDPFLPPELEREIFELAARNDPVDSWTHQHVGDTLLVLPQVCRRVQSWIEPFIYERVSLLQSFNGAQPVPKFLATVDARPASFFATHVKYLYMDYSVPLPVVQRILGVCTGAVSVGCHHPYPSLAHVLAPLPLHRLCVSEFALPSPAATLPPWAASLRQLGFTKAIPPDPAAAFAALPALTHLAVDYDALPNPDDPGMGAALARLLDACPRLRLLVLMTGAKTDCRWAYQRLREDGFAIGDPRFYVHLRPIPDGLWDAWSRRVPDVFVEAEGQLERRRAVAAAAVAKSGS
ncbi:Zn(2)-C6 fungal-type domain-containing protein [Mycena venus]|uniref:Zn(2)-C6 fungal-type domain-containing protein n=1 Tax=Mycena venus TaxID=2733690 RepID=A0A8H6YR28_9AGAR|nr:Zn(2)-C6 fungal-type domain-containing protein [Mycena venus]